LTSLKKYYIIGNRNGKVLAILEKAKVGKKKSVIS